ncbi:ABC transporter permease [Streptomyces rubellomurinus]|uniref:ABC transporter permease n=1 Tax=Streptomyces sp. Y1 TaxID=3238634 RepID=A0AB39TC14_9ACTN|nr:ABC transporter permease [Streptomyces rubellomurinus subsp. indigoferus]
MNDFVGTRDLIKLYARRDRVKLPVGLLIMVGIVASSVTGFAKLYTTAKERTDFANGVNGNAAQLFMYGPVVRTDAAGGLVAWRTAALGGLIIGLISLFTVIRHSRGEEETGRAELIRAGVVGPRAQLAAAFAVAVVGNVVTALYLALTMGFQGLPWGGSIALALGLGATGCVFAGIGAIAAQLTESARAARGIASAVVGAAFLLRALGDAGKHDLSWVVWLSPIGWTERLHPFADERWWVLLLAAATTALLTAAAFALNARRDLGAGLLPDRPGPATAAPGLRTPLALAWRLHRPALLGWSAGFLVVGAVTGGAGKSIGDQIDSSSALKKVFENLGGHGDLVDAYLATAMGTLGLLAAAYAVQAALRPYQEETAGRAEPVLATRTSRIEWAVSHLVFALLGPAVALAVGGLAAGLVYGASTHGIGHEVPRLLGAALVQLPAAWILAALTTALFGLAPRAVQAAWGALVVFLLLGQLGGAFGWNQKLLDVSPFTHIPRIPAASLSATPLLVLVLVAAALTAAGLAGFRRRAVGS